MSVIIFHMEKEGWANGWIMSGIALGQIIGIPLGTYLAEELGFKISIHDFWSCDVFKFF